MYVHGADAAKSRIRLQLFFPSEAQTGVGGLGIFQCHLQTNFTKSPFFSWNWYKKQLLGNPHPAETLVRDLCHVPSSSCRFLFPLPHAHPLSCHLFCLLDVCIGELPAPGLLAVGGWAPPSLVGRNCKTPKLLRPSLLGKGKSMSASSV